MATLLSACLVGVRESARFFPPVGMRPRRLPLPPFVARVIPAWGPGLPAPSRLEAGGEKNGGSGGLKIANKKLMTEVELQQRKQRTVVLMGPSPGGRRLQDDDDDEEEVGNLFFFDLRAECITFIKN